MTTKKKKKRVKVHWVRLTILLVICIGVVGFGTVKTIELVKQYQYEKVQGERREYIAQLINDRQSFVNNIQNIKEPDDLDPEIFNELKDMAIHDDVYDLLDQYNYEEVSSDISDEYFDQVSNITTFENEYSRILENISLIPENYIESLMNDWDRYDFTMAFLHQVDYLNPPDRISKSLDTVPLLIQWDLDWAYVPYGDLNIAIAGCAPTCISMVFSYLLKDPSITPALIAQQAEAAGMYVEGAGSSHAIFETMAAMYGLNCFELGVNQESIDNALNAGYPVILNMVPGDFTRVGHFIVLTGIENGQYKLNDPNSIKRSEQLWDQDVVLSQAANAWTFTPQISSQDTDEQEQE